MKKIPASNGQLLLEGQVDWYAELARIIAELKETGERVILFDLFCGGGGVSEGMDQAKFIDSKLIYTAVGINHNKHAIATHAANHPRTIHLIESVTEVALAPLAWLADQIRKALPYIKVWIWGSAECTHISNAKGGDSRDADSRSLSNDMKRYDDAIKPDLFLIENVVEIRSWGPLEHKKIAPITVAEFTKNMEHAEYGTLYGNNGRHWYTAEGWGYAKTKKGIGPWMVPIKARKREYFEAWKKEMISGGLRYEDRDLNAADFGAPQSRRRYYGQYARNGHPILWPVPTHAKEPEKCPNEDGSRRLPWVAVKTVLEMDDKGPSLFTPGRIKSNATFKRVLMGAKKFWPNKNLMLKYQGNDSKTGANNGFDINSACLTVCTHVRFAVGTLEEFVPFVVSKEEAQQYTFLAQSNGGNPSAKVFSVDGPSRVVMASENKSIVTVEEIIPFIATYHGSGHNCTPVDTSAPCIAAADINSVVSPQSFILNQYGQGGGQIGSVETAVTSVTCIPKINIANVEDFVPGMLLDHQFNNTGSSLDKPSPTVIAIQNKKPLHLVQMDYANEVSYGIAIYKDDLPAAKELKRFMAAHNIADIKMRMLKVLELLQIQGFDKDYELRGPIEEQKKQIGNAVEVNQAKTIGECYGPYLFGKEYKMAMAA